MARHKGPDGSSLQPEHGLQQGFRTAWSDAKSSGVAIPLGDVYFAICTALKRDALLPGGGDVSVKIDGVDTSWTAFARSSARRWHEVYSGGYDGAPPRAPTFEELQSLIRLLDRFGTACTAEGGFDQELRPPSSGGSYSCSVIQGPTSTAHIPLLSAITYSLL